MNRREICALDTALSPRRATVRNVAELTSRDVEQMFGLFSDHFANVSRADFQRDLFEKDSTILLTNEAGTIRGFTTIGRLRGHLDGEPIEAIFSGDTILAPECQGDSTWIRVWGRHVARLVDSSSVPLCWLLVTSTHRAYRFLPGFFHEYSPRHDSPTSADIARKIETLVRCKFGDDFNALDGIVRPSTPYPVRPERRLSAVEGLDDPHARFFAERNPRFLEGEFLVCLAELSHANLTSLGARVLR